MNRQTQSSDKIDVKKPTDNKYLKYSSEMKETSFGIVYSH